MAWVSYKDAIAELKSSKRKIADWFRELQHYGLIVLHSQGCLGTDGKGQSPHWRLTELGGETSHASSEGLPSHLPETFSGGMGRRFFILVELSPPESRKAGGPCKNPTRKKRKSRFRRRN